MINEPVVLLADIEGVIKLILFVLFFVIVPILTKLKGAGQPDAKPRPKRPPRPAVPPVRAENQPAGRELLSREIEQFLRRAAERRGVRPAKDVEVMEPDPVVMVRQLGPHRVEAEIVEAEPVLGRGVSAHVHDHIKDGVFEDRSSSLGADVCQADEKLEGRLHDVFDHRVGKLVDTTTAESQTEEQSDTSVWDDDDDAFGDKEKHQTSGSELVAQIRATMQDPRGVREAIILSEILRRPEDRF